MLAAARTAVLVAALPVMATKRVTLMLRQKSPVAAKTANVARK